MLPAGVKADVTKLVTEGENLLPAGVKNAVVEIKNVGEAFENLLPTSTNKYT